MSRVLTKNRLPRGQCGSPEGNGWSPKRKARGQLSGTACQPARSCQGAGAPLTRGWLRRRFP